MIQIQQLHPNEAARGFRLSFVEATLPKAWNPCCFCLSEDLPPNHRENRPAMQEKIAKRLLSTMREYSACRIANDSNNSSSLTVDKNGLGRPLLTLDGVQGPSISFSYHNLRLWGAMCDAPHQCGIDVASASEFNEKFPLQMVFLPREITEAIEFAGTVESAMPLLWSAKEAVVKAMGCGFHLVDPIEVLLEFIHNSNGLLNMQAHIRVSSNPAALPGLYGLFKVGSFRHGGEWVSIALRDA